MSDAKIVVGARTKEPPPDFPADPVAAWRLVSLVGLGLAFVAYVDLGLGVFPLRFGDLQWEFGTASRLFDSIPLATVATLLYLAGAVARGRKWGMRLVGIWSGLFAIILLSFLVVYALTVPLALEAVSDPIALTGLKKAVVKTGVQGIVYPILFLGFSAYGLKSAARVSDS